MKIIGLPFYVWDLFEKLYKVKVEVNVKAKVKVKVKDLADLGTIYNLQMTSQKAT